ncbi:MAG: hypothetical protein NZ555_15165 [Geminicoccaceae bacterium]|nr:hypothetical protein [Geminicoccaceae bacterium]MDW8371651.1 hypothetical protein [Geminicoccaceae bacterium]
MVEPPGRPLPAGPTRLFPLARIRGIVAARDPQAAADRIRRATLQWLEQRAGKLPPEAWNFGPFGVDHGGSMAEVARAESAQGELWAARLRYPDESFPGRVWRTEITLARGAAELRFGLKLDLAAREESPVLEVSVPRIARYVVGKIGLRAGSSLVGLAPRRCEDGKALALHLRHPDRALPAIVISFVEGQEQPWTAILQPKRLAERLAGIAEVHLLPVKQSFELSGALGKAWGCYLGAVRVYRAPFDPDRDGWTRHPLFLPERIRSFEQDSGTPFQIHLSLLVARESLGPARPELEVPTFARVQDRAREIRLAEARAAGQTTEKLLELAEEEIRGLKQRAAEQEAQFETRRGELEILLDEAEKERDEALRELRAARLRIAILEERLAGAQGDADREVPALTDYAALEAWAERHLAGRLVLLPRAIRDAKDGLFQDVALVGRALLYLAGPYRRMRLAGGEEARRANSEALAVLGLENSSVGGDLQLHADRFRVDWRGQKRLLDQHVKNGNARDPRYCLRIYYFWDEQEQLVVVGALPGHIRTGAT